MTGYRTGALLGHIYELQFPDWALLACHQTCRTPHVSEWNFNSGINTNAPFPAACTPA